MVRIAPVRLAYNPKTLWFDARDLSLAPGDAVVVLTARGLEFGHVDEDVFEGTQAQVSGLKSPLKPVKRLATEEDEARAAELEQRSREALPVFRQLASKKAPDMNPVSVEFLFDGDKAVFYFESDERVDFRDLVRDLAARFRIRVDMKQIGVRDEARMVGGIGHCGQELCCRRLGGEFNPVSIRMAKEQGLSLNPQKISGLCGRLMCCLRYEYDAYKDFHARAPKKNAKIKTPEGEGKVVDMDVPRENISIAIEGEKPVVVPLADMDTEGDSPRPNAVGEEAWERAHATKEEDRLSASTLLTSQLTEKDTLANPTEVRQVGGSRKAKKQSPGRSSRQRGKQHESEPVPVQHKQRRRRSTKVGADGTTSTVEDARGKHAAAGDGSRTTQEAKERRTRQAADGSSSSNRPRRRRGSATAKQQHGQGNAAEAPAKQQSASVAPGRRSSALRSHDGASTERSMQKGPQKRGGGKPRTQQGAKNAPNQSARDQEKQPSQASSAHRRPRRRSHRSGGASQAGGPPGASGQAGGAKTQKPRQGQQGRDASSSQA